MPTPNDRYLADFALPASKPFAHARQNPAANSVMPHSTVAILISSPTTPLHAQLSYSQFSSSSPSRSTTAVYLGNRRYVVIALFEVGTGFGTCATQPFPVSMWLVFAIAFYFDMHDGRRANFNTLRLAHLRSLTGISAIAIFRFQTAPNRRRTRLLLCA